MDYILGTKTHLNKFKGTKILQHIHSGNKTDLEISYRKITEKNLKSLEIKQNTSI